MKKNRVWRASGIAAAVALTVASTVPLVQANTAADDTPVESFIVGGHPAAEGVYPYMARLSIGGALCGGTLISPDILLTAQHCTEGARSIDLKIGKVNYQQGDSAKAGSIKEGPGPEKGDWAIAKLERPYTGTTKFAVLSDGSVDAVAKFRAIGWGTTSSGGSSSSKLLEVDVPVVTSSVNRCGELSAVEICAGDIEKGGIDTCQGDSGGPLFAIVGDQLVQAGITSWGDGCADKGKPGHYTKISAFRQQITDAIKAVGGQQPTWYNGGTPGPAPAPTATQPAPFPTQPPRPTRPPRPTGWPKPPGWPAP